MIILEPVKKFARDFNSEITVWMSIAQEYGVVSSAKLAMFLSSHSTYLELHILNRNLNDKQEL